MSDQGVRTFKVSPKGIITLASATQRELGLTRATGQKVRVSVEGSQVVIAAARAGESDAVRISPRGLIELPFRAHEVLGSRYAVKAQGNKRIVLARA